MKIDFTSHCHTSVKDLLRNRDYAKTLGFPHMGEAEKPSLAIVGGGPSAKHHLRELKSFDGEVWAINGAWAWCKDKGIRATFCSADSIPEVASLALGVEQAFIATHCHKDLFDVLKDADIEAVDVASDIYPSGPTTATAFPLHAIDRGHNHITYFGCESSWKTNSHTYKDESSKNVMRVQCNGREFLTQPHLAMQAEILAALIISAPSVFSEQSGGLLRALTKNPKLDVLAVSANIHESLVFNGVP